MDARSGSSTTSRHCARSRRRPPPALAGERGMDRCVWDLHAAPPRALQHEYPISAIRGDTPREPRGPWVLPGSYTVRLTVDGVTLTQPLVVRRDPRVRPGPGVLEQQFALALRLVRAMDRDTAAWQRVHALQARLRSVRDRAAQGRMAALDSLDARAAALESGAGRGPRPGGDDRGADNLTRLNADLVAAYNVVEGADSAPTAAVRAVVGELERSLARLVGRLRTLEGTIGEL